MPVLWSPDSEYAKERRKFETTMTEFGPPGRSPAEFTEYPLMLYRAKRLPSGGPPVLEHHIVDDELQERNMRSRGFVRGPDNAIKELEASEQGVAIAAAERAAGDRKMSEKAQTEAAKVDDATISHLGEIPRTPIKPRGRPRKQE
jgi:hypothetical protein